MDGNKKVGYGFQICFGRIKGSLHMKEVRRRGKVHFVEQRIETKVKELPKKECANYIKRILEGSKIEGCCLRFTMEKGIYREWRCRVERGMKCGYFEVTILPIVKDREMQDAYNRFRDAE